MAKRYFDKEGKYDAPKESYVKDFGEILCGDMPDNYEGSASGIDKRFEANVSKMKKGLNRGPGSF